MSSSDNNLANGGSDKYGGYKYQHYVAVSGIFTGPPPSEAKNSPNGVVLMILQ